MTLARILMLLTALTVLSGCQAPFWTLTDDNNAVAKAKGFEITLPKGWNRTTKSEGKEQIQNGNWPVLNDYERISASRDGTPLHIIVASRRYHATAFPHIKKKCSANTFANELADLYVSNFRKANDLERLQVVSNKPASINSNPGFQVVMEYKNDDGLRIRVTTHGFTDKTGFYTLTYRAPALYYYERDYPEYMKVIRSFRKTPEANNPQPDTPRWARSFT